MHTIQTRGANMSPGRSFSKDDLFDSSPDPDCLFKKGDPVIFTNEYGVKFHTKVLGFSPDPEDTYWKDRYIHLDLSSWWFPHSVDELSLIK